MTPGRSWWVLQGLWWTAAFLLSLSKSLPTSQCMLTLPALLQQAGAAAQFVEDLTLLEASRGSAQGLYRRTGMGTPAPLPAVVSGQAGDVAAFGRLVVQLYRQRVLLEAPDNSRCAPTCIPPVKRSRVHSQPLLSSR